MMSALILFLGGLKTHYGQREPWKQVKDKIGRTKPSRAPEKRSGSHSKSDGRPPDTSRQLLSNSNTAMNKSKDKSNSVTSNPSKTRLPSYPWSKNSCWLDTSLELIFYVTMRDFSASFAPRSASLNPSESAWALYQAMELRQVVREDPSMMKSNQTAKLLSAQCDDLRKYLRSNCIIQSQLTEPDFIFVGY